VTVNAGLPLIYSTEEDEREQGLVDQRAVEAYSHLYHAVIMGKLDRSDGGRDYSMIRRAFEAIAGVGERDTALYVGHRCHGYMIMNGYRYRCRRLSGHPLGSGNGLHMSDPLDHETTNYRWADDYDSAGYLEDL
jgi:hypothetical protein